MYISAEDLAALKHILESKYDFHGSDSDVYEIAQNILKSILIANQYPIPKDWFIHSGESNQ